MRSNWILTTAVVAMSVAATVGAQPAKGMGKPSKSDMTTMTYTGCVESVNHGGWFLLSDVEGVGGESMNGMAMTPHDDMAMKGDAAKTMPHEQTPMADAKMNGMPSTSFALSGSANFSKHVGQKVSVTGSVSDGSAGTMRHDVPTLMVKTLKVIAKSCS